MDKRLLTIQDISCVGQCSLTVALPVISACGIETAILPSSVLSNHTAFSAWTFTDLTSDMPKIMDQWIKEGIDFDAFYTGYVSKAQIPYILEIMNKTARKGALRIVDPVMADNGKLYAGFDADFPEEMKKLCFGADVIMPNLTEACLLLGLEYDENQTPEKVEKILKGLYSLGAKNVILTGCSFEETKLGTATFDGKSIDYYFAEKQPVSCHGTGDVFASAVAGAMVRGKSVKEAAKIGADFVVESIKQTLDDKKDHWYGVKFEKAIPYLINRLEK